MLKVECESCKAPYQIDERRVPPTGLKMRCPKCGHSFLVTNPNAPAAAAPPGAPPGPPRAPKPTMVGIGMGEPAPPPPAPAPPAPPAAPPKAPPPVPAAAKRTMMGVAAPVPMAAPAPPPAPPSAPPQSPGLPSDFPAALRGMDESDLPVVSAGLPVVSAGLPAVRGAPPQMASAKGPGAPAAPPPAVRQRQAEAGDIDFDLPIVAAAGLPATKPASAGKVPAMAGGSFELDLPALSDTGLPVAKPAPGYADLPAVAAGLPVVSADLPSPAAALPAPAAGLPSTAAALPATAQVLPVPARGFGEIDLPNVQESLPSVTAADRHLPTPRVASSPPGGGGAFGEIELPREVPGGLPPAPSLGPRPPPAAAAADQPDFGDLDLGGAPQPQSARPQAAASRADAGGGMAFGELDFGGDDQGTGESGIGVDQAGGGPAHSPSAGPGMQAAATAPVSIRAPGPRVRSVPPATGKRSIGRFVGLGVLTLAILGGAALQLTPYGAYGYLFIGDMMHAKDYAASTVSTMAATEKTLGSGTYDDAKNAIEAVVAAHVHMPRVKPLTAYAAVVDYATTVRFGADVARASRAKQLLAELAGAQDVKYMDVALASQLAESGDLARARAALDAASRRYPGDPILVDVALLRGDLELVAKDPAAAVVAFKQAAAASPDARAHFGLARGYDALLDAANTQKEIDATLAASPMHPGALTLRARRKSAVVDDSAALKDLAMVIEGAANAKASPIELSNAYAARAWVNLERGSASEAREAFAQAVKLDPRNVAALNGEGRLLLNEGRNTEALARFDTAMQVDPNSPESIANDAEAKLALERLADAKAQLTDARPRFPKSLAILLLLGKVEQRLNNNDAAEQDLRAAISFADPARPDAVLPFVALSELLSARGRLSDAKTILDDARKRLPPSAALDRAVGEVAEAQGDYDTAITQYRTALTKAPKDVATHFRLAMVLRRVRKFDEAGAELDRVAAVDKDYPGLSLERGLLFEESGDVDKAIEQFKAALAKAPDDPDLQLRVGSAYVAIGRPEDALPMLRKVLDKKPTSAEAHHYIGRALMLQGAGEQVEALRFLKKAVDLDPNRAEFHVYLAWAANDAQPALLDLARDEIDKALALDKLNPEAYWQRGVLERIEGAIDNAIKDERRALELRPSRYEAHATLAECFDQKNDDATAIAEWGRAIAGDGPPAADGTVKHPLWRYEYGKLLLDRGGAGAALGQLLPAALTAEKNTEQRPGWLAPLEFLTAEALRKSGRNKEAAEHYRRFLEIAPVNSPDRADAQHYLAQIAPQ